ncbi:hypothetical protein AAFF_G00433660 [Aldrovandia affinis]|uniref:Lysosome-associated membrane glycoprotein 2 n=1 Tax=Aldrovandia affinis TaxID=143900 RepID=A0AAD7S8Q2_9TELE|nr:hypothetical protein AAFF_G00433660 [Aldrovandia affinis]
MFRYACMILFLVLGSEIQLSYTTEVFVNDTSKKLCLYANLNVNFTVTYEVAGKTKNNHTVQFPLPEIVNATGSTCANNTSTLKLSFGKGHSWTVSFTKENKTYSARNVNFTYSLADDGLFPNASSNETKSVAFNLSISDVVVDTYYSCKSEETMGKDSVTQKLWDVSLQAFIRNGSKSENDTVCARDRSTTTPKPTTHMTSITTPPTPSPLPPPTRGNYSVNVNGTTCLLADMGLQISYNESTDFQEMNIEPGKLHTDGTCGVNRSDATLLLISDQVNITFTFSKEGKKFYLHEVNIAIKGSSGTSFIAANTNLSLWQASLNSSYMCNTKQSYNITRTFSLNTLDLHVQPFAVKDNTFSTADECSMDDTSILIPIVVGAALGGLIIIVLIAYAIGRRKTYVGYQSL